MSIKFNCLRVYRTSVKVSNLKSDYNKEYGLYCSRNYLEINVNKTKCMKFRRGGRLAVDDKFYISKKEVKR